MGETTITVTTEDGGYKATCRVSVQEEQGELVPAVGIDLNKRNLNLYLLNQTSSVIPEDTNVTVYQLIATVLPEDATNKDVTWTSSNPNIATVDENGNFKALSNGRAIIEAKTEDGQRTARATVIVFTNN